MKHTAKRKAQSKRKAEHKARHQRRNRHGERKLAKRVLKNEPVASNTELEKARPTDTGRFGA